MVDSQGRFTLKKNLISRSNIDDPNKTVFLYYNPLKKIIILRTTNIPLEQEEYYLTTVRLNNYRIQLPADVLKTFSESDFLPTEKNGEICIHIVKP